MSHATAVDYFKPQKLFPRTDWGAKPRRKKVNLRTPVIWIVIKHTLTDTCQRKEDCVKLIHEIQRQDMHETGQTDIQYNYPGYVGSSFLISSDGTLYEGRGWDAAPDPYPKNKVGSENDVNEKTLLIGMIGDPRDTDPTTMQEISVLNILGKGLQLNVLNENVKFLKAHEVGYEELELEEDSEN